MLRNLHFFVCTIFIFISLLVLGTTAHAFLGVTSYADTDNVEFSPRDQELRISVRACPPRFFFGSYIGQDKLQRMLNEQLSMERKKWHDEYVENNSGYVAVSDRVDGGAPAKESTSWPFGFFKRAEEYQNRCSVATVVYSIKAINLEQENALEDPQVIQRNLLQENTLKVGLRNGYPKISLDKAASWNPSYDWSGAAYNFAQKIAQRHRLTLEVVKIGSSSSDRYEAIEDEDVDLVISMISDFPERRQAWKKASWSKPYLTTGLVVGTFDGATAINFVDSKIDQENGRIGKVTLAEINREEVTVHVGRDTTAESFVRQNLPNANLETYGSSSSIYEKLKSQAENGKDNGPTLDIFVTDYVIAIGWGASLIPINGFKFIEGYDNDKYTVIGRNDVVIRMTNDVIDSMQITQTYQEALGEGKLELDLVEE